MNTADKEGNCGREKNYGMRVRDILVGWREKADQVSLSEVGEACETYAMLLGYRARRGVNNSTLQWDRPNRCLVTNIFQEDRANTARLPKGNRGWPHEHCAS